MFRTLAPKFKFSRQHRRELQNLVIDHNGPGTILRDFEAVLTFFKDRNLPLTGRRQLPLRVLPEINALLARPLQLATSAAKIIPPHPRPIPAAARFRPDPDRKYTQEIAPHRGRRAAPDLEQPEPHRTLR
jgi:hypothetical protein